MKKLKLTAGALATFAALATFTTFANSAHAQSSVTLYGALDTALAWFGSVQSPSGAYGASGTRGANAFVLSPGNEIPNLWGLKGREDLGNGLSAIFDLESGFNLGNGQSGQGGALFGRQAFVGLDSKSSGTVTLGRQYDPVIDLVQPLTEDDTYGSAFATPGDIDNYDNSYRTNNALKYASPDMSGLKIEAMYGFGGQAGSMGAGQTYAGAISYNHGPFGLAAGYFHATNNLNGTASFAGFSPALSVCGQNCDSQDITGTFTTAHSQQIIRAAGTFTTAHSQQIIRAAGTYAIGPVTVGLAYSNVQYHDYQTLDASSGANRTTFNTGQVFVNYPLTPVVLLAAGYDYTKGSGNNVSVAYNQFTLGANYSLSKRTTLYALGGYQHSAGQTWIDGQLMAAPASMADFGQDANGTRQGMVMVGLNHRF